ncbi:MAG: sigma-54-dependent transcriptional regulator [Opitutales bacterium]
MSLCNPFLPERIEWERRVLGPDFRAEGAEWNRLTPTAAPYPNLVLIERRVFELVERSGAAWPAAAGQVAPAEARLFTNLVLFALYLRFSPRFDEVILASLAGTGPANRRLGFYAEFQQEVVRRLRRPGLDVLAGSTPEHLFACLFQVRRAFHHVHNSLVGGSPALGRLRGAIWESVFTRDLELYRRVFWARMQDFTTLIAGPSGTGKELVARAISLARYIPFDARTLAFASDFVESFYPLNLSALSPTLVESELFGHRKGAFTGAWQDHAGWLETCPPEGTVFLDEVGEVAPALQVKLLRVLQARTFSRLGETKVRRFQGKIIAATNRDLPAEIRAGRFREDFYYRLCSDQILTPSLREQLQEAPEELAPLVAFVVRQQLGSADAAGFTPGIMQWITRHLGPGYSWPGNVRELEQCVRNLFLRGSYVPAGPLAAPAPDDWNALLHPGGLTAEEVLRRYTRHVHALAGGNVEETARRLDLDRRTVKARLAACRTPSAS